MEFQAGPEMDDDSDEPTGKRIGLQRCHTKIAFDYVS